MAKNREYNKRQAKGIVGYQLIAVTYLCINRPVRYLQHLSEFTTALLHIFTHTNDFSFLLRRFMHLSQHLTDLLCCERRYYLQIRRSQHLYFHYYYYFFSSFLRLRALFWVLRQFILAPTSCTLILDTSRPAGEFIVVLAYKIVQIKSSFHHYYRLFDLTSDILIHLLAIF